MQHSIRMGTITESHDDLVQGFDPKEFVLVMDAAIEDQGPCNTWGMVGGCVTPHQIETEAVPLAASMKKIKTKRDSETHRLTYIQIDIYIIYTLILPFYW